MSTSDLTKGLDDEKSEEKSNNDATFGNDLAISRQRKRDRLPHGTHEASSQTGTSPRMIIEHFMQRP